MKQPKKLTRNQKEILVKKGIPLTQMRDDPLQQEGKRDWKQSRSKQEVHDDLKLSRRQKRILKES